MEEKKQTMIFDDMTEQIIATTEKLALSAGAEKVTVRMILQELGITNRVFYNRFHNIDEVLTLVYEGMVLKIRQSILSSFDPDKDYFEQIIDIVANTLILSYHTKMNLNHYVFASDSLSDANYEWWKGEIRKLIEIGKARGYLEDVNSDIMSYAVWCFIRGYNADALGRKLPKEEAIQNFRYAFGILLDGMKRHP